MPNWQAELEQLLARLQVSMDRGIATETADGNAYMDAPPAGVARKMVGPSNYAPSEEVAPVDGEEVTAVRNELEATVRRVFAMAKAGQIEPSLRDDVLFVLQALTRPHPRRPRPASPDDSSGEWQLASAAAVLHFCRIVLRLSQALDADEG
jgi:hypothetical protein